MSEPVDPGNHRVTIGRWATMAKGGLQIKDMAPGDVYWLATQCTGSPETRAAAIAYMDKEPERFEHMRGKPRRRRKIRR